MTDGSRVEKIQDVLRSLRAVSPDIFGSAMVSIDGLIIASLLPPEVDEELVCQMAVTILGAGERLASELVGSMEQAYVRGRLGYVILNAVGREAILVVLTTPDVKLNLVFIDVRRRVAELAKNL